MGSGTAVSGSSAAGGACLLILLSPCLAFCALHSVVVFPAVQRHNQ